MQLAIHVANLEECLISHELNVAGALQRIYFLNQIVKVRLMASLTHNQQPAACLFLQPVIVLHEQNSCSYKPTSHRTQNCTVTPTLKIWEFGDTFILILRGKPIDFLHIYHHAMTELLTWCLPKS